jgi:hypothetical protein
MKDKPTYTDIPSFHHGLWNFIDVHKVKPDSAKEAECVVQ